MESIENFWRQLHANHSRYFLDCLVPYATMVGSYILFNIPYLLLEWFKAPQWLMKYKVQPQTHVRKTKLKNALTQIAINIGPVAFVVVNAVYFARKWRGCSTGPQIPGLVEVLRNALVIGIVEEMGFYYTHRFFHSSVMYKRFHKIHHEWTSPISVISIYCHPLEHVVCNLTPVVLGPFLAGSSSFTTIIWYVVTLLVTTCHHSGYDIPLLPSPKFHDYHHEKFTECFGALGVMDYLHGTSIRFRQKTKKKI